MLEAVYEMLELFLSGAGHCDDHIRDVA
jgi:hypothetical protein